MIDFNMEVAGHTEKLTCDSLHCQCGMIEDGVGFKFGNHGGWVISLKKLEEVVQMAQKAQGKSNA